MVKYMTLAMLLWVSFSGNAQQQIKILNAFQHYKIQASTDYSKLVFLTRNDKPTVSFEEAYLNDWEDAFLVVNEEEIYSIKARYNIFDDTFYVAIGGQQRMVYPHLIQGVVFKNRIFVSRKEMLDSGLKDSYYELLSGGKNELLKKYTYNYRIDRNGSVRLGTSKEILCIKNNQGLIEELYATPKEIFNTFGEGQMVVKIYAKENALNLNRAADLKKLFDHYNRVFAEK